MQGLEKFSWFSSWPGHTQVEVRGPGRGEHHSRWEGEGQRHTWCGGLQGCSRHWLLLLWPLHLQPNKTAKIKKSK